MYLAEDRVMCVEIMIKKGCKYYLAYIPDAKSSTDAPGTLAVLIKQRRRWTNGSLFGTLNAILHIVPLLSCRRTKHSLWQKFLLFIFMIYYTVFFMFGFLVPGGVYASVTIFFSTIFNQTGFTAVGSGKMLGGFFEIFYIGLMLLTLITSLTQRVDSAKGLFGFVSNLFGLFMLLTFSGIIFFLVGTDPSKLNTNTTNNLCDLVLFVTGLIVLGVYLAPIFLRPLDFIKYFIHYVLGLISYLYMVPTFVNVFTVYAFCNLHDISWGNRPAHEVNSSSSAMQEKLKIEYEVFRSYVLYVWFSANIIFGGAL
jgi:chitin synthase